MTGRESGRCVRGLLAAHLPAPARGAEPSRAASPPPVPAPPRREKPTRSGAGRAPAGRRGRPGGGLRGAARLGSARRGAAGSPCAQPRRREGPRRPRQSAPGAGRGGTGPGPPGRAAAPPAAPAPCQAPPGGQRRGGGPDSGPRGSPQGSERSSGPRGLLAAALPGPGALLRASAVSPEAGPGPWGPGQQMLPSIEENMSCCSWCRCILGGTAAQPLGSGLSRKHRPSHLLCAVPAKPSACREKEMGTREVLQNPSHETLNSSSRIQLPYKMCCFWAMETQRRCMLRENTYRF
ncbi:uncharacterized protein LOC142409915 [Mycteria americana]|uniref:uncharacterized protein LOC142409915 n=1 Tax=Mycteria americana TaxID=33587 RepID=UPI003F58DD72